MPGKRTLAEAIVPPEPSPAIQRMAAAPASSPRSSAVPAAGPRPTLTALFGRRGAPTDPERDGEAGPEVEHPLDAAPASAGGGQALPAAPRARMEQSFGSDFSAVRIHEGSEAQAVGAVAYTQGDDIFFAPGQYDPDSPRGQALLGHELAHVVQQRQGRVQATGQAKGVAINDAPELEHEADAMGARAARGEAVAMGSAASSGAGGAGAAGAAQRAVIQRAIGLEIESSPDWQAYDRRQKGYDLVLGENRTLLETSKYRLETELSGKLEFVIEPPVETPEQLVAIVKEIQGVVGKLENADTQKAEGFDAFMLAKATKKYNLSEREVLKQMRSLVYKPVKLFPLQKAVEGAADVLISQGPKPFQGGFQATVGVHLSAIPALFEMVKSQFESFPSKDEMTKAQRAAGKARQDSIGLPFTWYNQMSPEMEGLLNLIYYYLMVGSSKRDRMPFPKGITQVMARTNFAQMFSMTPEAQFFAARPEYWVKYVTEAAGLKPDDKIFRAQFGDVDKDPTTIDLTCGQWLLAMVGTSKAKGVDRLSVDGGGPQVLKTMGATSKTDDLGVKGETNRGVIVELRGLDATTHGVGEWDQFALKIANGIQALNARNDDPKDKLQANQDVARVGHGAELFWSPLTSEQQAGKDVYAMAVEAYQAPFKTQVAGLLGRARARAEQAFKERESM